VLGESVRSRHDHGSRDPPNVSPEPDEGRTPDGATARADHPLEGSGIPRDASVASRATFAGPGRGPAGFDSAPRGSV